MNRNIITDIIHPALRAPEPLGYGNEKHIFGLAGEFSGYLLAISRDTNIIRFHYDPDQRVEAFNSFLKTHSSLTDPAFSIFYKGLPITGYGQPLVHLSRDTRATDQNPDIAIHTKVEGVTLSSLDRENAMQIMAEWPQETFNDLMLQAKMAVVAGHALDTMSENIMIHGVASEKPKITLIDLIYETFSCSSRSLIKLISAFEINPGLNMEMEPNLLEKLLQAAELTGFGFIKGEDDKSRKEFLDLLFSEKQSDLIFNRLKAIPAIEIQRNNEMPEELSTLGTLSLTKSPDDLLAYLKKIAEADRRLHPPTHSQTKR